ncbi:hypothetical protein MMC20_005248 [Loxospora ochrophaea]|nr:hypothetical protein [Loxospora ochrophaea]
MDRLRSDRVALIPPPLFAGRQRPPQTQPSTLDIPALPAVQLEEKVDRFLESLEQSVTSRASDDEETARPDVRQLKNRIEDWLDSLESNESLEKHMQSTGHKFSSQWSSSDSSREETSLQSLVKKGLLTSDTSSVQDSTDDDMDILSIVAGYSDYSNPIDGDEPGVDVRHGRLSKSIDQ